MIATSCSGHLWIIFLFYLLESVVECPRNCHGNGECVSGSCHCFPGFLGPDCSRGKSAQCFSQVTLSEHEEKLIRKATSQMFFFIKLWWRSLFWLFCCVLFHSSLPGAVQWQWAVLQRTLSVLQWLEGHRVWRAHESVHRSPVRGTGHLHHGLLCLQLWVQRRELWRR